MLSGKILYTSEHKGYIVVLHREIFSGQVDPEEFHIFCRITLSGNINRQLINVRYRIFAFSSLLQFALCNLDSKMEKKRKGV